MMNKNLKNALLLTSASVGLLSLSAVTTDVASAETVSGSASVTNIDGSTYSVGGEISGISGVENLTVAPAITQNFAGSKDALDNLVLTPGTTGTITSLSSSVATEVAADLNALTVDAANISLYTSVVRAAAGADGLE